jgi:putative transcriptional regulator
MTKATKSEETTRIVGKDPTGKGKAGKKPISRGSGVGAEILEALEEVRDALKSGEPLEERFTVRSCRFGLAARDYRPDDVRSVRRILSLSQPLFAEFLGVDASTVRSWEQGKRPPSSIARRFMDEISADPVYWRGRLCHAITKG